MDFVGGRTQGEYLERTWYSAYHLARRVACDLTSRDSGRSDHAIGAPPQLVDGEQLAAAVASAACLSGRQRWSARSLRAAQPVPNRGGRALDALEWQGRDSSPRRRPLDKDIRPQGIGSDRRAPLAVKSRLRQVAAGGCASKSRAAKADYAGRMTAEYSSRMKNRRTAKDGPRMTRSNPIPVRPSASIAAVIR